MFCWYVVQYVGTWVHRVVRYVGKVVRYGYGTLVRGNGTWYGASVRGYGTGAGGHDTWYGMLALGTCKMARFAHIQQLVNHHVRRRRPQRNPCCSSRWLASNTGSTRASTMQVKDLYYVSFLANAVVSSEIVQAFFVSGKGCRGGESFPSNTVCNITGKSSANGQTCHLFPATTSSEPCVRASLMIALISGMWSHGAEFSNLKFKIFRLAASNVVLRARLNDCNCGDG